MADFNFKGGMAIGDDDLNAVSGGRKYDLTPADMKNVTEDPLGPRGKSCPICGARGVKLFYKVWEDGWISKLYCMKCREAWKYGGCDGNKTNDQ